MIRHIVLIVIDCLRADHASCYGYARETTPTLDRLAARGVLWTQAHSCSSWTKPSVASLLTGLYPTQHGTCTGIKRSKQRETMSTDVLATAGPTLAEAFTAASWRCGAFANNAQLSEFTRLNRGFETYVPTAGKADRLIDQYRQWLESDQAQPSFAYLHFLEAHWPYKPRRRHMEAFGGDRDTNYFRDFSARDYAHLRRNLASGEAVLSDDRLADMVRMYDAAVRRLDGKVKIILAILEELKLLDETMVVVTADHGDEFLEHGRIGHGHSLYRELTHVPLVATIPGGPAGVRDERAVSLVDLPATLLALAGIEASVPGANLVDPTATTRPVCAELTIRNRYTQMLTDGRWRLYRCFRRSSGGDSEDGDAYISGRIDPKTIASSSTRVQMECYDLDSDPDEQHDLASSPDMQAMTSRLCAQLDQWWKEAYASVDTAESCEVGVDREVVQRLRDLGYLD